MDALPWTELGLSVEAPSLQRPLESSAYKRWYLPDDSVWAEFYRENGGYYLRFPRMADFLLSTTTAKVLCRPAFGTDEDTIQHIFLSQVVPLAQSMQGKLILHASAIEIADQATLFAGESGRGKSTLATYCASRGHSLISDDGVTCSQSSDGLSIAPAHTSVRLWEDSFTTLFQKTDMDVRTTSYSTKKRIICPPGLKFAEDQKSIGAVFHLRPPTDDCVEVERLSPRQALVDCLEHYYLLDDRDPSVLATHFDQLAALSSEVPHFSIKYPRSYTMLEDVRAAIVDTVWTRGERK